MHTVHLLTVGEGVSREGDMCFGGVCSWGVCLGVCSEGCVSRGCAHTPLDSEADTPCGQTDTCENITLPQTLWAVMICQVKQGTEKLEENLRGP